MSVAFDEACAALEASPRAVACVVGPTASGKTALAIALCKRLGGEVVGADSVQIYRGFDVGSGKPSAEERAAARHHLVDIATAHEPIDAARFAELADQAIADVWARGRRPILCGGTFLWVRATLFGLAEAPSANPELRAHLEARARDEGRAALHAELARVDPLLAARLHPNDFVRVSRALEVAAAGGPLLSARQAEHGFARARHEAQLFGVLRTPEELTNRIAGRTATWLDSGWIEEVHRLRAEGMSDTRAMQSVGYREVAAHLDGQLTREELAATIVRATRVFARRQRTWLTKEPVTWLPGEV